MENQPEEQTKMMQTQTAVRTWSALVWENIWKVLIVLIIVAVLVYYFWNGRKSSGSAGTPAVSETMPANQTFRINKIRV